MHLANATIFFFIRVEQEQEALSESNWGDQQFQNVTGKVRVDFIEINHKISRRFTKSRACISSTSDHPTQTIPYSEERVTMTPKFANLKEETEKSYLWEWQRSC